MWYFIDPHRENSVFSLQRSEVTVSGWKFCAVMTLKSVTGGRINRQNGRLQRTSEDFRGLQQGVVTDEMFLELLSTDPDSDEAVFPD